MTDRRSPLDRALGVTEDDYERSYAQYYAAAERLAEAISSHD